MDRQEALKTLAAANAETTLANSSKTHASHSRAAALHTIASKSLLLAGDEVLAKAHAQFACDHEVLAFKAREVENGSVVLPAPADAADAGAQEGLKANDKNAHLNDDGTFKGGFDGCVVYMQTEAGGGHSKESATKICGSIAAAKNAGDAGAQKGLEAAASLESNKNKADKTSDKADKATDKAMKKNMQEDHVAAAAAHKTAATEHKVAAIRASADGDAILNAYHAAQSENHRAMADMHGKAAQRAEEASKPLMDDKEKDKKSKKAAADKKADICSLKASERMLKNEKLVKAVGLKAGGPGSGRRPLGMQDDVMSEFHGGAAQEHERDYGDTEEGDNKKANAERASIAAH